MGEKNKFSFYTNEWSFDEWQSYIKNLEYKVVSPDELPDFLKNNDLIKKFNSCLVAASASNEAFFFSVIGFRPDRKNTVMDQEPYAVLFDSSSALLYSGFFHHSDYEGRTVPIEARMTHLLNTCSVTSSIACSQIPTQKSGSLLDLEKQGLLTGTKFVYNQIEKQEKEKNK